MLEWGEEHLQLGTFARGDYREFLQLAMVCLGGNKEGFTFRQPGADHHAWWMSKGVYYLKMFLLSHHFQLSEEEQEQITKIVTFVLIIYLVRGTARQLRRQDRPRIPAEDYQIQAAGAQGRLHNPPVDQAAPLVHHRPDGAPGPRGQEAG